MALRSFGRGAFLCFGLDGAGYAASLASDSLIKENHGVTEARRHVLEIGKAEVAGACFDE